MPVRNIWFQTGSCKNNVIYHNVQITRKMCGEIRVACTQNA